MSRGSCHFQSTPSPLSKLRKSMFIGGLMFQCYLAKKWTSDHYTIVTKKLTQVDETVKPQYNEVIHAAKNFVILQIALSWSVYISTVRTTSVVFGIVLHLITKRTKMQQPNGVDQLTLRHIAYCSLYVCGHLLYHTYRVYYESNAHDFAHGSTGWAMWWRVCPSNAAGC